MTVHPITDGKPTRQRGQMSKVLDYFLANADRLITVQTVSQETGVHLSTVYTSCARLEDAYPNMTRGKTRGVYIWNSKVEDAPDPAQAKPGTVLLLQVKARKETALLCVDDRDQFYRVTPIEW